MTPRSLRSWMQATVGFDGKSGPAFGDDAYSKLYSMAESLPRRAVSKGSTSFMRVSLSQKDLLSIMARSVVMSRSYRLDQ
jgi:hypothetical protein